MSNVTLEIGGRSFTVACAPGEEAHITNLGRIIESKLGSMDGMATQSEGRMLLFACLLLADELHELRNTVRKAKQDEPPIDIGQLLELIAEQLENLVTRLEPELTNA